MAVYGAFNFVMQTTSWILENKITDIKKCVLPMYVSEYDTMRNYRTDKNMPQFPAVEIEY